MRNPHSVFHVSQETAWDNQEEGEDDAKSAWPFDALGGTHVTMGPTAGLQQGNLKLIPQTVSQFGLRSETRPHEAGIASNRQSAMWR